MTESSAAPEIIPELSASAHKINRKKLGKSPYDHTGKHPGSLWFRYAFRVMIFSGLSIIFRKFEFDKIPENKGGRISVATHINGLIDPSIMIKTQKKRIISLGRHDLVTGPVIGWWARRDGAQPVLRKAEINAGVTDPEFAKKINNRSMLTVANCLAGGHGAVIMPEGKSHQDSKLHAFRTGFARAALVAAAIAKERQKPLPVIQPTGLHWNTHYWFRANSYVEYAQPIKINLVFDKSESARLAAGEWIEPPFSAVLELKDKVFSSLSPMTPDSPDWETYRAWKLIANLEANRSGKYITKLSEEVHATRAIRDKTRKVDKLQAIVPVAIEAAEILNSNGLDCSSIDSNQKLRKLDSKTRFKGLIGLILMISLLLPTLVGSGIQSALARYLADKSDEGQDARTTYFFLAGFFSPVFFWPVTSILIVYFLDINMLSLLAVSYMLIIIGAFYLSSLIFLIGYDFWSDYRVICHTEKLSKSPTGKEFNILVENLDYQLGLLI